MGARDFYDILGVPRDAEAEAIRKAYKKIALESHPDRNPGDKAAEAKFKEATEAFSVLSDPRKRQTYDFNLGLRRPGSEPFRDTPFRWNPQDMFEDIVGAVRSRARREARGGAVPNRGAEPFQDWHGSPSPISGEDIEEDLRITLEEAAAGCIREVVSKSKIRTVCQGCSGSGCVPGTGTTDCGSCGGSGRHLDFRVGPGERVRRCPACRGSGRRPVTPCAPCRGRGRIMTSRNVKVRVPAGIDSGQRLRLAGMGAPGEGAPPGDLFVTVHVVPHDRFRREGADLFVDKAVPLSVAVMGGPASVPTLDGPPVRVDVPPGAEPGKTVVTVRGAGMREAGAERRGDLHVLIQIKLPKVVTPRGARLLEELMDETGFRAEDA